MLDRYRLTVRLQPCVLILWFSQFGGYLDLLIGSSKGLDRLIQFWSCFYTGHISVVLPTPLLPTSNQMLPFHLHSQILVTQDKLITRLFFSLPTGRSSSWLLKWFVILYNSFQDEEETCWVMKAYFLQPRRDGQELMIYDRTSLWSTDCLW